MRPERIEPGEGQESVWDYPRPPIWVPFVGRVRVLHGGITIADTTAAIRVLETSQPPGFYIPSTDVRTDLLNATTATTMCEWKGAATYWDLALGSRSDGDVVTVREAAWSYERPTINFAPLAGHLAFYAQKLDECWVDDEQVLANPGSFYGGWITSAVVGPFKGVPGSMGW
jgi:uncharacterized protein (DUF427 family)